MHKLLKKFGINRQVASIIMIAAGIGIWYNPEWLAQLFAIYLIVIGIIKLIPEK